MKQIQSFCEDNVRLNTILVRQNDDREMREKRTLEIAEEVLSLKQRKLQILEDRQYNTQYIDEN